jgi:alcohol dehydrogenase class IV
MNLPSHPNPRGDWNWPTRVRFGAGRLSEAPDALAALGVRHPLLVTDPGVAGLPFVTDLLAHLEAAGRPAGLFTGVRPNPTVEDVEAGVGRLRTGHHDGVIALGGGSALDAGKAIALMARQTRPLLDFEDVGDNWTRVDVDAMAPCLAVPTTSGTGSEVGRASVITDTATHTKRIIFHPRMLPPLVIADPALTVGLPRSLTAATGIDALSHALEAFCAPGYHPLADGVAAEAIRLVHGALRRAADTPDDLSARADMMAASLMGATAFQKGLGAMHGMAHVIGAHLDAHHGLLNAIVMPYVLQFNRRVIEERIAELARTMGLSPSFHTFLDWVLSLRADLGIPHTLAAVGLTSEHIPVFAAASVDDPSTGTNPVPMDATAYVQLYRSALEGRL